MYWDIIPDLMILIIGYILAIIAIWKEQQSDKKLEQQIKSYFEATRNKPKKGQKLPPVPKKRVSLRIIILIITLLGLPFGVYKIFKDRNDKQNSDDNISSLHEENFQLKKHDTLISTQLSNLIYLDSSRFLRIDSQLNAKGLFIDSNFNVRNITNYNDNSFRYFDFRQNGKVTIGSIEVNGKNVNQ